MFNYIVFTNLTSSTSSVSVHNDGFIEYNKWNVLYTTFKQCESITNARYEKFTWASQLFACSNI